MAERTMVPDAQQRMQKRLAGRVGKKGEIMPKRVSGNSPGSSKMSKRSS